MFREPLALLRGGGGQIEFSKIFVDLAKKRLEFLGLTAVRGRGKQNQMLLRLLGDATNEVVTLLLLRASV